MAIFPFYRAGEHISKGNRQFRPTRYYVAFFLWEHYADPYNTPVFVLATANIIRAIHKKIKALSLISRNRALDDQTIIPPRLQLFKSTYDAFRSIRYDKLLTPLWYLVKEYYSETFKQ